MRELTAVEAGELAEDEALVFYHHGKELRLVRVSPAEAGLGVLLPATQIHDGKAWSRAFTLFSEAGGGFVEPEDPAKVGRPGGPLSSLHATLPDPDATRTFVTSIFGQVWGVDDVESIETLRMEAKLVEQAVIMDHIRDLDAAPVRY